jgi:Tol biopolymer transport system component
LDDHKIIVGDDGEIEVLDLYPPEKPKRKRKPFSRPLRVLMLFFLSLLLIALSSVGAYSIYSQLQVSQANASAPVCIERIRRIAGGGNSVVFQNNTDPMNRGAPYSFNVIAMDRSSNTFFSVYTEAVSFDISEDQTQIVESRYVSPLASYMIYVWPMDDASNVKQLTEGEYPSFSPDGTQIAFFRGEEFRKSFYIMNSDGIQIRRLTNVFSVSAPVSWSPDGSKLLFSTTKSEEDMSRQMYMINIDGSNRRLITENSLSMVHPAWSPDGERIAYSSQDIYTMNVDGSDRQNLTQGRFKEAAFPVWSLDSKSILFLGFGNTNPTIYRMDNDGGGLRVFYETCPQQ